MVAAGLAVGLGFLCKYTAAYLIVAGGFSSCSGRRRGFSSRTGPYLALLIFCILHAARDRLEFTTWLDHRPTCRRQCRDDFPVASDLRYFFEFFFVEMLLLNPVFYIAGLVGNGGILETPPGEPAGLYLFCVGGVVFLGHLAYSLHSRILPNWRSRPPCCRCSV